MACVTASPLTMSVDWLIHTPRPVLSLVGQSSDEAKLQGTLVRSFVQGRTWQEVLAHDTACTQPHAPQPGCKYKPPSVRWQNSPKSTESPQDMNDLLLKYQDISQRTLGRIPGSSLGSGSNFHLNHSVSLSLCFLFPKWKECILPRLCL